MENSSCQSIKIYVVSLKDKHDRRSAIKRQLDGRGWLWEFFDALDFRVGYNEVEEFFSQSKTELNRELSKGELACAASHQLLYRKIAREINNYAVIIEDDAIVSEIFWSFLSNIAICENLEFDVLIIGYSKLKSEDSGGFYLMEPIGSIGQIDGIEVGVPWKNWTCGTVGYILSRRGVNKLIKRNILTLADDWSSYKREFDLEILHSRPLMIFEDFENFESTLQKGRSDLQKPERKYLDSFRIIRGALRSVFMKIRKISIKEMFHG